jgi:hypothetical protein
MKKAGKKTSFSGELERDYFAVKVGFFDLQMTASGKSKALEPN